MEEHKTGDITETLQTNRKSGPQGEKRNPKRLSRTAKNEVMEMLSLIGQLAVTMLVPIAACTLLGWYIGKKTGFTYASILGFFIGAVAGYQSVYKLIKKYIKKQ